MRAILTTVALIIIIVISHGQPNNKYIDDIVQPDPNEASLGKYGDIPVGLYTGTASVGVPIHTLKQGPLSANIALSYHTGGIRAEEMASRVGLGWTLVGGGSVTRTVNGFRDTEVNKKGYYHNGSELGTLPSTIEWGELVNGERDGEADLFSFSCGGYSGKFYFDADNEVVLVPLQDVKVMPSYSSIDQDFDGFIIITPEGNRHHFGKYSTTTAYTLTAPNSTASYRTTWHLLRTETYDRTHAISYIYENDNYSYTSSATGKAYVTGCSSPGMFGYASGIDEGSTTFYKFGSTRFYYHTTNISGKRLASVSSTVETVSFVSNKIREDLTTNSGSVDATKELNEIRITTGSSFCKKFILAYDYFEDNGHLTDDNNFSVPAAKRLKLESVTEKSCDNSQFKPPYTFTYNDPTALVWRHTKGIDHWGYPNGQIGNDNNLVNVPRTQVQQAWHGNSHRNTNKDKVLPGSLQKITYPTLGHTEFLYDANSVAGTGALNYFSFELTNCITPTDSTCCHTTPDETIYTFSDDEIGSILFELELGVINPLGLCDDTDNSDVFLKAYAPGNGIPIFSRTFNLNPGTGPQNHTATYTGTDVSMFVADVPYRFQLTVDNGQGKARIGTTSTVSQDRLIGGLRIKQTTDHDGISIARDKIRTYHYEDTNGDPSGTLYYDPVYGQFLSGYSAPSTGGQNTNIQTGLWSSSSFVPMSAYENSHIGYDRVSVEHNGNGHEIYEYHTEVPLIIGTAPYPAIPPMIITENGKEELHTTHLESGGELAKVVTENNQNPLVDNSSRMYRISNKISCGLTGSSGAVFVSEYNIRTEVYRVEKVTSHLDGVETITEHKYHGGNRFYVPVETKTKHSDNKTYHTVFTYPQDDTTGINAILRDLNILIPVKTEEHVGTTPSSSNQIDGTETIYANFGTYPYPQEYMRYERTYNAAGTLQAGAWVSQAVIGSYDSAVGLPDSINIDGWKAEKYEWYNTGLLKKRTFINFVTSYDYLIGTRLLQKVTNVDQTSSSYTYDGLWRLKTANDDCRMVTTTLDYEYGSPAGGNYVKTITDYTQATANSNSALAMLTNRQYFDGLGRPTQVVKEDQGPTINGDIVIPTEYDNQGRVYRQYEPKKFNNNSGAYQSSLSSWDFATTGYEPSPLNRPISSTHEAWDYPTTTTYGKNTSTINGIPAGNLYKQTVIDPDLRQSIVYTDTRGRTIASTQAGANGVSPLTTYTNYDDKDRVVSIIPPGATLSSADLIFAFTYYRNDLVATKKVPDSDIVNYRYNDRDLLISYQDGYLRNQQTLKWMTNNYDDYGRIKKTGFRTVGHTNNDPTTINAPAITTANRLSQTNYYSLGVHVDKPQYYYWRELKPDGTLGLLRRNQLTYDACGRNKLYRSSTILSVNNAAASMNENRHDYTYDGADNITFDNYQVSAFGEQTSIDITRTIDFAGRPLLTKHKTKVGDIDLGTKTIAKNTYNEKGLIENHSVGHVNGSSFLQTCNFTYMGNQWLEQMTSGLFSYEIFHNESPQTAGQHQKNGNISEIHWQVAGGDEMAFGYNYDNYNRLTDSYSKNVTANNGVNDYQTKYGYDVRGNMNLLRRRGKYFDATTNDFTQGWIDLLTLSSQPESNKLKTVTDGALPNLKRFGTQGSTSDFIYDNDTGAGNGNMTFDPTSGATMTYNHLNLPRLVDMGNGGTIEFTYDANGIQLRKVAKQGSDIIEDRYYIESAEYEDGELVQVMHDEGRVARQNSCDQNQYVDGIIDNTFTHYADNLISSAAVVPSGLTTFQADESIILNPDFEVAAGKILNGIIQACNPGTWVYEYSLKDHLGSTRVVFDDKNEIIQESHNYAFGMEMTGDWMNTKKHDYNYLYTGKELHKEIGLQNFGFRFYNSSIARFVSVDPMTEERSWLSPYNYVQNNPISRIDPDGAFDIIVDGISYTPGSTGEGESDFVQQTFAALNQLLRDPSAGKVSTKERSGHVILDFLGDDAIGDVEIVQGPLFGNPHVTKEDGTQINFSEDVGLFLQESNSESGESGIMSAATILGHEFGHAWLAQASPKFNALLEKIDDNAHNLNAPVSQEHRWLTPLVKSFSRASGEITPISLRAAASNKLNAVSPSGTSAIMDYFLRTLNSTSRTAKNN